MKNSNPLRTKLISLMYLLFIALAVIDPVLDDIDAFTDLNRTLENANIKLDQRNLHTIAMIESFKNLDSLQYSDIYDKAMNAHQVADTTVIFLENIKVDLIKKTGGMSTFHHLKNASEFAIPTRDIYKSGMGVTIKSKLEYTKKELLAILGNSNQAHMLDTVLRLDDMLPKSKGTYYKWDKYYFYQIPINAVVALLTKFQNDVRVAESMVINQLNDDIQNGNNGKGNYNLDFIASDTSKLDTIYLAKGVKKHDVFNVGEDGVTTITLPVNKRDQSQNATIYIYDDKGQVKDSFQFNNGVGEVKLPTDQIGEFRIKGVVKFRYPDKAKPTTAQAENKDGKEGKDGKDNKDPKELKDNKVLEEKKKDDSKPFQINYKVSEAKPYISQKEYKTLYIGINNPLNIYHPDHPAKDLKVNITQGKIVNGGNEFFAIPNREGFASVTMEVPDKDGKGDSKGYKKVAEEVFKVRELPKPSVTIYNKEGGSMPSKIFKQQKGLTANGKELPVDLNFRVTEFQVTYINANGLGIFKENVKGSYFTGKSRELIDLAQPGDIFIFDNIHVKGPDGLNKNVDALVFSIL